ncbi:MAG: DUF1588 domain-containing protein [Bryobacteraceae bacterium]
MPLRLATALVLYASAALAAPPEEFSFDKAQAFLKTYCHNCHKTTVGGFDLNVVATPATLRTSPVKWNRAALRTRNGEMPPKGSPAPSVDARVEFAGWVEHSLRQEACADGIVPGPAPIRRLNRDEYSATIRDMLDIHMDFGATLPVDGAGGEGFDNAAETLFLSPLHSEKYLEAAKFVMDFAAKEYKSRQKIFVAYPGKGVTADQAARRILESFLPRAFRRPVTEAEIAPYIALYQLARKQGNDFEPAILFALRGALVSPNFLFLTVPPQPGTGPKPIESYALASRISYFLWGSLPDEFLTDLAAAGKLHEPAVLRYLVERMLRNDRSLVFAQRFTEQWLGTRDLRGDKAPDAKLFPAYAADEELRGDIRFQPILFFRELLTQNLSLLNFIESKGTIATSNLAKHFGEKLPVRANASKQPQWVELPEGSTRGGLLGMPAVLAVSSHPYRTSPVLRGAWVLDTILGTPPPPPPPNVPALEEPHAGAAPKTLRDRLVQHRANPVCASCHEKIDPPGFALENYDVIGRWRTEDAGKAIDSSGEFPDGTKFNGPTELKAALLQRKDLFIRHLTAKMLGYALGRGLTLKDSCTVDAIAQKVKDNDYKARTLIEEIVLSVPFRYQMARPPQTQREQTNRD